MSNANQSQQGLHFRILLEGADISEVFVNADVTAGQIRKMKEAFVDQGYTVLLNGEAATDPQIQEIVSTLNRQGVQIRVNGSPATDSTQIPQGALVVASGEYKGGC